MMLRRTFLASASALLASPALASYTTAPFITKQPHSMHEAGLFVWNGGLYRACFRRNGEPVAWAMLIQAWDDAKAAWYDVATIPWARGLGCMLVDDGKVWAFGTTDWTQAGNSVKRQEIDPLTWSLTGPEFNVVTAPAGVTIYNSSVCKGPDGFRMVYETDEATAFSGRFLQSTDMASWSPIGDVLRPTAYNACQTIRYVEGGWYMLTWLWRYQSGGKTWYITNAGKTQDFVTVQGLTTNVQVVSPMDTPREGTNNSDVDFIEYDGRVCFVYLTGDQASWAELKTAWYEGTLPDLFGELWP
jgi:hypothetical protein